MTLSLLTQKFVAHSSPAERGAHDRRPRLKALELGEAERAASEALAVRRRTAQGLALRARIVLACAEMGRPRLVGARLAVHPDTVRKWRHRFAEHRFDGLRDG